MNWHHTNPYGGADWAGEFDIRKAGMFHRSERSVFAGFFNRQPIYAQGQGGLLVVAAPRSGKLSYAMARNVCGPRAYRNTCIYLDPKGEIAAISQNHAWLKKPCFYFNPTGLFGFPSIRINPLDHIIGGAANIVSATKSFYNNWMKLSGSANGRCIEFDMLHSRQEFVRRIREQHRQRRKTLKRGRLFQQWW
ncbi:hypothetical protein [Roseibium aggregatum]|uniref:hypothetical protein n=1 Tax=Roseibium aggregatum TaxID=187304 RepID=UPI0025ABC8A0|nr:hypothetical protein [Roseibium aggregatum]WJS05573.1 hypothetical protein QUB73_26915 [Roseibium aggregatum]